MKILLVHNNYGKYSGEEAVVDKMSHIFSEHVMKSVFIVQQRKEVVRVYSER